MNQIKLHYQPQVSSDGKALVGLECLLRSLDGEGRVSGPGPILQSLNGAEEADELDRWIIEQAIHGSLRWPQLKIAVNIRAEQFQSPDFLPCLDKLVKRFGIPAGRLELELLEDGLIGNFELAVQTMGHVRAMGIGIALDDFGTGYSSLSYLQKLPIDKLKLDKSLVDGVGELRSAAIVHAVTALARALGLKVVAEGVETVEQQRFLRAAGCHLLQGFLFSPAVDADSVDALVREGWPR